jgi:hypothetical protein
MVLRTEEGAGSIVFRTGVPAMRASDLSQPESKETDFIDHALHRIMSVPDSVPALLVSRRLSVDNLILCSRFNAVHLDDPEYWDLQVLSTAFVAIDVQQTKRCVIDDPSSLNAEFLFESVVRYCLLTRKKLAILGASYTNVLISMRHQGLSWRAIGFQALSRYNENKPYVYEPKRAMWRSSSIIVNSVVPDDVLTLVTRKIFSLPCDAYNSKVHIPNVVYGSIYTAFTCLWDHVSIGEDVFQQESFDMNKHAYSSIELIVEDDWHDRFVVRHNWEHGRINHDEDATKDYRYLLTFSDTKICDVSSELKGWHVCLHSNGEYFAMSNFDDIDPYTFEIYKDGIRTNEIGTLDDLLHLTRNRVLQHVERKDFLAVGDEEGYDEDLLYAGYSLSNTFNVKARALQFMERFAHKLIAVVPNLNIIPFLHGKYGIVFTGNSFDQGKYSDWVFDPSLFIDQGLGISSVTDFPFKLLSKRSLLELKTKFVGMHQMTYAWMVVYPMQFSYSQFETSLKTETFMIKRVANAERLVYRLHGDSSYISRHEFAQSKGWVVTDGGTIAIPVKDKYYPLNMSGHMYRSIFASTLALYDFNSYLRNIRGNFYGEGSTIEGVLEDERWHSYAEYVAALEYSVWHLRKIGLPVSFDVKRVRHILDALETEFGDKATLSPDYVGELYIGGERVQKLDILGKDEYY